MTFIRGQKLPPSMQRITAKPSTTVSPGILPVEKELPPLPIEVTGKGKGRAYPPPSPPPSPSASSGSNSDRWSLDSYYYKNDARDIASGSKGPKGLGEYVVKSSKFVSVDNLPDGGTLTRTPHIRKNKSEPQLNLGQKLSQKPDKAPYTRALKKEPSLNQVNSGSGPELEYNPKRVKVKSSLKFDKILKTTKFAEFPADVSPLAELTPLEHAIRRTKTVNKDNGSGYGANGQENTYNQLRQNSKTPPPPPIPIQSKPSKENVQELVTPTPKFQLNIRQPTMHSEDFNILRAHYMPRPDEIEIDPKNLVVPNHHRTESESSGSGTSLSSVSGAIKKGFMKLSKGDPKPFKEVEVKDKKGNTSLVQLPALSHSDRTQDSNPFNQAEWNRKNPKSKELNDLKQKAKEAIGDWKIYQGINDEISRFEKKHARKLADEATRRGGITNNMNGRFSNRLMKLAQKVHLVEDFEYRQQGLLRRDPLNSNAKASSSKQQPTIPPSPIELEHFIPPSKRNSGGSSEDGSKYHAI
jgi:hypothetical protein